jgi:hypothetical protein
MAGIDSDFWLDFAKESVTHSIESLENDAAKLDTFLVWTWSIYTSVFVLASVFDFLSSNLWQVIFVAQPILIIMLSRYLCTVVSLPLEKTKNIIADPNDVASIIKSYNSVVEDKRKKLELAKIFTLCSIISITVALVCYNCLDPNKDIKQEIRIMKLKKDNGYQEVPKAQQNINDSIKSLNEYDSLQIQNILLEKKLKCIENNDTTCLKFLKLFE